jgi:hypothetical protein
MLHNCTANPVHCWLRSVGIYPPGHDHGGGYQGAPGLPLVFHWHLVLPVLLLQHAHHPPHSSHWLFPQSLSPPLLWLLASLVHQDQYINGSLQHTSVMHLDTKALVSNSSGALFPDSCLLSLDSCSPCIVLITSCSMWAFFLAIFSTCAIKLITKR